MPDLTVILVPGAFHVASVMDIFGAQLQRKGFDTRTWGLKTVNVNNVSVDEDAKLMAEGIFNPLIEGQGKDIVLYLHSYAGFPGTSAIAGFSKAERLAKGLQGGIIGLIYQSAFVPKPGNTLLQTIGGSYAPWQDPDVSDDDDGLRSLSHSPLRPFTNAPSRKGRDWSGSLILRLLSMRMSSNRWLLKLRTKYIPNHCCRSTLLLDSATIRTVLMTDAGFISIQIKTKHFPLLHRTCL